MSRADATARALIERFRLTEFPVDLDKLASQLGVTVIRQQAEPDVSGILMRREDQDVIGLNDQHSATSQRFSLAHALAHHQIHRRRDLLLDVATRYSLGNLPSLPTDREEAEANRFAAALLAPELVVRKMAAQADFQTARQLVDLLAPRFEISRWVMSSRLIGLGIVMDH